MFIIIICISLILKSLEDQLIFLVLNMQLIKSLTMYDVSMPPNVETYIGYIRQVVDGEMLKPDIFIDMIWPGETIESIVTGKVNKIPMKGNI